jgi:hypothetical protein
MHARTLAAGPETRLAAVWARRTEAAQQTAAPHHAHVDLLQKLCLSLA